MKTDPKAISPLTSKPGTLSLLQSQAQYLVSLLAAIPSKGTFAIHKARLVAVSGPQLGDWNTARNDLLKQHALTEDVDSGNPESGKRILAWTSDEVNALRASTDRNTVVPALGEAKFADDQAKKAFVEAFDAFNKELLIVWDLAASVNLHKGMTACFQALMDDHCPEIHDNDLLMFERLLEEIEVSLTPVK